MLKKLLRKLTAKKWQTCGSYSFSKKWASNVGIIGEMKEATTPIYDDHLSYFFKIQSYGFEEIVIEFKKRTLQDAVAARESLVRWIKDVQG